MTRLTRRQFSKTATALGAAAVPTALQRAFGGVGGMVVRPQANGEVADRVGQLVGQEPASSCGSHSVTSRFLAAQAAGRECPACAPDRCQRPTQLRRTATATAILYACSEPRLLDKWEHAGVGWAHRGSQRSRRTGSASSTCPRLPSASCALDVLLQQLQVPADRHA